MKLKMYAVYDSKVEAYLQPFFMQTKGEAIRGWQDVCNDPKTNFYKHPADYTLFELGAYDSSTGQVDSYAAKISLGTALEHRKPDVLPPKMPTLSEIQLQN